MPTHLLLFVSEFCAMPCLYVSPSGFALVDTPRSLRLVEFVAIFARVAILRCRLLYSLRQIWKLSG